MKALESVLKEDLWQSGRGDVVKFCEECNTPMEKDMMLLGKVRRVAVTCFCVAKKLEEEERRAVEERRQAFFDRMFKNSFMDNKYRGATFENWNHSVSDEVLYKTVLNYAKEYKRVRDENIGIIIYGGAGCGKTYAACCIANFLLGKGVATICISINGILDRIKATYDGSLGESEEGIIKSISKSDFLIIDDLGVELKNEWALSRIYKIIDGRYRSNLPTIITTNLSMVQLKARYDERVYGRIREMCTPFHCNGGSIRREVSLCNSKSFKDIVNGIK